MELERVIHSSRCRKPPRPTVRPAYAQAGCTSGRMPGHPFS